MNFSMFLVMGLDGDLVCVVCRIFKSSELVFEIIRIVVLLGSLGFLIVDLVFLMVIGLCKIVIFF